MSIPVFKPSVKRKELDSVLTALVADKLGPGSVNHELVKAVCGYLGLEFGVALREYGRALETVLECLGAGPGSRVILSPLSPSIFMEFFLNRGIEPLFADVDPDTGCISVESVRLLLDKQPCAIIVHESLGFLPDLEAIVELGLPIVEDISQSLGANSGVRKSGTYGSYVLLSMEPEGIITTGGGTMIIAGGKKETAVLKKITSVFSGTTYLQDMNAALGVVQIRNLELFINQRKEIAQVFSRAIMQTRHKLLIQKGEAENVFYSFPVLINSGAKDVIQYARKKNIEAFPAFEDSILGKFEILDQDLNNAQSLLLRCVLFPLYPSLGKTNTVHIEKVLTTLP